MKLLQEKLPTGGITQITHVQVVGRDPAESQHIREQFTQEIRRNVKKPYNGPTAGFSHFVREELVDWKGKAAESCTISELAPVREWRNWQTRKT